MPAPSYGLTASAEELEAVTAVIARDLRPFGFDIETGYEGETREEAQLHPEENLVAGFSLTNSVAWARYCPVLHDRGINVDPCRAAELIWPLFFLKDAEGLYLCVPHGGIFEKRCMARFFLRYLGDHPAYGEQVRTRGGYIPLRSDTMLESYAEGVNLSHGLKPITEATFPEGDPTRRRQPGEPGHKMTEIFELFPDGLTQKEKDCIRFNVLDQHDPRVFSYACEDALWCLAHHHLRFPVLRNRLIYILEMALLEEVCPAMSDFGVWYDWDLMREASRKAHEFLPLYEEDVRAEFAEATGEPCLTNFASPKQMVELLYEKMKLPVLTRTPSGAPSTNAKEVLVNFVEGYPAIAKFVAWKELETLCNNFLDTYERKYSYADDGRTHPNFLQHGTVSGRGAHDNPNYAQTSKKKYKLTTRAGASFEFQLRKVIGAPPGYYMLGFDYSMVELRVVAGEAGEPALLQAFHAGVDVHKKTGALMTGTAFEDVTSEIRATGKTCNFSLGYGQSAGALAQRLGCTQERADELYGIYHATYPRLDKKRQAVIAQARQDGYVITKFGRRVPLPDILLPGTTRENRRRKSQAERTAGNVFVQGPGSGDYPKMAMVRAVRALKAAGLDDRVHLVMNIHDALEFYVRKDVAPADVIRVLAPAVVFPVPGWPPIVADWHLGLNWAELREIEVLADGSVQLKGTAVKVAPAPVPEGPAPVPVGSRLHPAPPAGVRPVVPRPVVSGEPRRVIIDLDHVPGKEGFSQFLNLAGNHPGANQVTLLTPRGTVRLPSPCGLSPEHEPEISVLLGGAVVRYDHGSVNMAALGAGLTV